MIRFLVTWVVVVVLGVLLTGGTLALINWDWIVSTSLAANLIGLGIGLGWWIAGWLIAAWIVLRGEE